MCTRRGKSARTALSGSKVLHVSCPGIRLSSKSPYSSWCQNTDKSFTNEQEARDFVAGRVSRTASKFTGDKFYGVAVGHHAGVYEDWADASEQIKGVKGPKYKKFATRAEAEEFVRTGGRISTLVEEPKTKRARTDIKTPISAPTFSSMAKTVRVYTDGSSRGNGKQGAFAGVGVFFGDGDPRSVIHWQPPLFEVLMKYRNISEPLFGELQTNQRAELTAVQKALEIVSKNKDMQIVTDSNYTINCCEVWYKGWQKNGWKTSNGGPVLNKDLVIAVRKLIDDRVASGAVTSFQWIKGHSADPGNEAADRLAVAGAFAGNSR